MNQYLHLRANGNYGVTQRDTDQANWDVHWGFDTGQSERVWRLDEDGPVEIDKPKPPLPFDDWENRLVTILLEMEDHLCVGHHSDSHTRNDLRSARSNLSEWRKLHEHRKS